MSRAAAAGALYFLVMFLLGFVLGTVRVIVLAPRLGEWGPTLIELPIMLILSWLVCRRLIERFEVPGLPLPRLMMGAIAFSLLMIAEVALGIALFGRSLPQQLDAMTAGPGLAGLLGQLAFAAFPLVQRVRDRGFR